MQAKIASLAVAVGTQHWPSPWAYMFEAGRFPTAVVRDGKVVGAKVVGQGRGVNIRIPAIPDLPEDWEFVPGVSRIFIIHRRARAEWNDPPVDILPRLASIDWPQKAEAEKFAMLTYADATALMEQDVQIPEPTVIIQADGETVILDNAAVETVTTQPFLAWRIHHLLLAAVDAGATKATFFPGGVIGWTWMAQRPFVRYTRNPATPPPEDARVTLALISADSTQWNDPTGRTHYE